MLKRKVYLWLSLVFMIIIDANAQNKQILFGLNDVPQTLLINPGAKVDYNLHIGIPLLSHIHLNIGSSSVSAQDVFENNTINFNTKLRNAIATLNHKDFWTFTQQLELLNVGFRIGNTNFNRNTYLSFGLYQEADAIAYFPNDYVKLALEGNQNNINKRFDLSHLNLRADLLTVLHFGYNKTVSKQFTYGFRAKIYSSAFSLRSFDNFGSLNTRLGSNNIFEHHFNVNLKLQTSGFTSLLDDETDSQLTLKEIQSRLLLGGDLGLGLDFGFTYNITNQFVLEASVQDLGFVNHKNDVQNYKLIGNYTFEGIDPLFGGAGNQNSPEGFVEDVAEAFDDLFAIDTTQTKFTTWRPIKINTALRYAFDKEKANTCDCNQYLNPYLSEVGAQLFMIKRPVQPQFALTLYYYRRLFNTFSLKTSYTIDSYSYSNFGFGVSTQIGAFNLYAVADNLFGFNNLSNTTYQSFQFGLNLIFDNK